MEKCLGVRFRHHHLPENNDWNFTWNILTVPSKHPNTKSFLIIMDWKTLEIETNMIFWWPETKKPAMKTKQPSIKVLICIFLFMQVSSMFRLRAQDYQISFAGSGGSATVDSVFIENLTQGTTLKMKGTDVLPTALCQLPPFNSQLLTANCQLPAR